MAITSTVAKTDDGGLDINFSIPRSIIDARETDALEHLKDEVDVPGFRKGKAPLDKVKQKVSPDKLLQHTLGHILPQAFAEAVAQNKLNPAMYPRFEIISKGEKGKDPIWQIRAQTCEIAPFDLPDYKKIVKVALKTLDAKASIQDKQDKVINTLVSASKIT